MTLFGSQYVRSLFLAEGEDGEGDSTEAGDEGHGSHDRRSDRNYCEHGCCNEKEEGCCDGVAHGSVLKVKYGVDEGCSEKEEDQDYVGWVEYVDGESEKDVEDGKEAKEVATQGLLP